MAPQFPCANSAGGHGCQREAQDACKKCRLVAYCSPKCQNAHWKKRKKHCKSDLGKKTWIPDWAAKNRQPTFISDVLVAPFGGGKYLWGNVPAFDVLQLGKNEGTHYGEPLNILFAASGDLRNVVKTVTQLPDTYNKPLDVTLNDKDPAVVARNLIILLIAMTVENRDQAVDAIIHIWYSALIRKSDLDILQTKIRPLIESAHKHTTGKASGTLLGKKWTLGGRSLRLVLRKSAWDGLLSFLDIPNGLIAERADGIRRAVTLAEERRDYRDRHRLFQSPSRRVANNRFREDGCLLPFGSSRGEFLHPNPTLFQDGEAWPMFDCADPIYGWDAKEVEDTPSGPADGDIYGRLYYYLRGEVGSFIRRISGGQVSFTLFQMDVTELPKLLNKSSFSRIEVSNISDRCYLGVYRTLECMVPLLQEPEANPHATLITLFMNVVDETMIEEDHIEQLMPDSETFGRLLAYLPLRAPPTDPFDTEVIKRSYARSSIANYEHILDRFMLGIFVTPGVSVLRKAGLKVKHTIVEEWPFRLKLEPGEPGAQEEFDRLLAGGSSGKECYVEWKRLLSDKDMEAGADDDGGYTGEPTSSQLMTPTLAHLLEQYLTM